MTDPVSVGFIGLGQIGKPMARRLTDWPGGLTVCDANPAATRSFGERGVAVAATPAEVAERATVISIMVRDDVQVTEVLTGVDGILSTARPGTVVAVHSTVEADTPSRLAALAAAHDVHLVDAPVSGGTMGAANGTLALMVGGSDEAVELVREPFGAFAGLVAHLGPVGAGTRAKLARNLITFAAFAAVGEALALADAAGVDLGQLGEVVRHSDRVTGGPGSVMLRTSAAPLDPTDGLHDIFTHTRGLGEKDLQLALALGNDLGVDLPVARLALDRLGAALGVPHQIPPA
ncbi:MAG: putative enzyme [Actinomycetia bacterium]|nr:putative enzyme [Actinomycetes bacterium]